MYIGRLRNRITIQSMASVDAGTFGVSNGTWSDVKTVYAEIRNLSASERDEQHKTTVVESVAFRIRIPKSFSVTEKMRIRFRGGNFYITGIQQLNANDQLLITGEKRDNG